MLASLAALAIGLATPAAVGNVRIDDLAGNWVFVTQAHATSGCVIRGDVVARRNGDTLAMIINARETCPNGSEWRAIEQCRGALARNTLRVRCVVESADPPNYNADHFNLTVVDENAMIGRLADGVLWNVPVTWRRPTAPMIS